MSMPQNLLSTEVLPAAFSGGRSLPVSATRDFETGGIALSNPLQGHLFQIWETRIIDKSDIQVQPENGDPIVVYSGVNITEVSLTFDQNMRATFAFVEEGSAKLRWYDSSVNDFVTTVFGVDYITPRVSLDDKRATQMGANDIVLAYLKKVEGSTNLYHRLQRDRFGVEYLLQENVGSPGLIKIGMNRVNRFQFLLRYA